MSNPRSIASVVAVAFGLAAVACSGADDDAVAGGEEENLTEAKL